MILFALDLWISTEKHFVFNLLLQYEVYFLATVQHKILAFSYTPMLGNLLSQCSLYFGSSLKVSVFGLTVLACTWRLDEFCV